MDEQEDGFRAIDVGPIREETESRPKMSQPPPPDVKVLSDGAHVVTLDTHMEHSDSDGDEHEEARARSRSSSQPRRKRTKTNENELLEKPVPKVKHYDSKDVRKYMAKQRADRKRRQQEEEDSRKRSEEAKMKHLEELYKKQKETARQPVAVKGRGPEVPGAAVRFRMDDVERSDDRHPERLKQLGAESDKENQDTSLSRGFDDSESDSSTLTEAAIGPDLAPPPPPARAHRESDGKGKPARPPHRKDKSDIDRDLLLNKYLSGSDAKEARPQEPPRVPSKTIGSKGLDPDTHQKADDIMRKLKQQTGMSVDDIVNKYAKKAEVIGKTFSRKDPAVDPLPPPPSIPERDVSAFDIGKLPVSGNTRLDRIQAIKNTASSLQTRLHEESQRLVAQEQAWAQPRNKAPDFVSRYQKMMGTEDDYTVFDRDLPGVQNLGASALRTEDDRFKTSAATKIQAAYRGHTVRQSLTWGEPKYTTNDIGRNQADSRGLVTDSDGDSIMTEDSISDDFLFKKPQALPPRLVGQVHPQLQPSKPVLSWPKPKPDKFSAMNMFTKQQRALERVQAAFPAARGEVPQRMGRPVPNLPSSSHDNRTSRSRSRRTESPDSVTSDLKSSSTDDMMSESYQDDFTGATSTHKSAAASRSYANRSGRPRDDYRSLPEGKTSDHDEDSLNDTLTDSLVSDVDMKESSALVPSRKSDKDSDWSDVSSLTDESDITRPTYAKYPSYHGNKFSPAVLDHKFAMELNNLETMEESLRQLTDVERVRSVSMAQQETVSLAQILKARQQVQAREMAELQSKAQKESMESARQLEEVKQRAADATKAISQARSENMKSIDESTRRLIETQTEAAKATAQAAKHLADIKGGPERYDAQFIRDTASAAATSALQAAMPLYQTRKKTTAKHDHSTQYTPREVSQYSRTDATEYTPTSEYTRTEDMTPSYASESFESYSKSSPRMRKDASSKQSDASHSTSSEVKTAEDLSQEYDGMASTVRTATISTASDVTSRDGRRSADSSICTESGARDIDMSKTESVAEEIGSEKDFTVEIETEEELERSMREVLPSEGQRKKLKRQSSREELGYISSDELTVPPTPSRRLSFEEDSFTRFTAEMVSQYMRDEEIRAKHQRSLLRLREQALVDKTKAELAWLEQQKQRTRNKGADDSYPQLKQQQQGIIRKLKQEQAEIKRLKEKERAASKERQLMLKQTQEITKLRKSAHEVQKRLKKVADVKVEQILPDDLRIHLQTDDTESAPSSPSKDKHDSEIQESFHKLKLMKLDRKYLTSRERKLQQRRERAEELIAWKQRLDVEEARISEIEQEVVSLKRIRDSQKMASTGKNRSYDGKERPEPLQLPTPEQFGGHSVSENIYSEKPDTARSIPESIYSEKPDTARSVPTESVYTEKPDTARSSIPESIYSEKPDTARSSKSGYSSIAEEVTSTAPSTVRSRSHVRSASDVSIPEEEERTHDDTEINSSVNEDYSNDTFETTERTQTGGMSKSYNTASGTPRTAKNRLPKFAKENGFGIGSMQISPTNNNIRKNSESESEDSFSVAASETSDASDIENRIRTLTSELKHRKLEAERLKRENQRRRKEKLRQQEELLKQQIENYDKYIDQYKADPSRSPPVLPERHLSPVRPQIKPPGKSSVKTSERAASVDRHRSEGETGSRSNLAVSFEDNRATISKQGTDAPAQKKLPQPATKAREPKTSAPPRRVPTPPPSDAKSPRDTARSAVTDPKSDVTDNITEDILMSSRTDKPDKSELMLQLDKDEVDDKVPAVTPRSARDSRMDSARSIPEIPEDYTVSTARSEVSDAGDESVKLKLNFGVDKSKSEVSESKEPEILSARSDASHGSIQSEVSDRSASQRSDQSTTRSYSTTRSDRTTERSTTYDDDYSEDSESYASATVSTKSVAKDIKSVVSEKSPVKTAVASTKEENDSEVEESIHTQDDISEAITEEKVEEEEESKSSEVMFQVGTTNAVIESPREPLDDFKLNDRVSVEGFGHGTLRFKGFTKFIPGLQGGVELDEEKGTNDGSVDGTSYFKCARNHGVFVSGDKLGKLREEDEVAKPAPQVEESAEPAEEDESMNSLDTEMEKIISCASESVERFLHETIEEEDKAAEETQSKRAAKTPVSEAAIEDVPKVAIVESEATKKERATNLAVQTLLDEAVSQMLSIRRQRKDNSQQTESGLKKPKVNVPMPKVDATVEKQEPKVDIGDTDDLPERPSAALDHLPDIGSPTDIMGEDLYNFDEDVDDPWNDDDLGFGLGSKPATSGDKRDATSRPDLKLDLHRLMEEIVVPNSEEEIISLVDQTVDFFWERRRYGESWRNVEFQSSFLTNEEKASTMEAKSRRVYKKLVFDLTSQVLCDMYSEEDEDDETGQAPWPKRKNPKRKYHKGKSPPTTVNVLQPIVEEHVKSIMGFSRKDSTWRRNGQKWNARKKKDRVDQILVQELREDEPQWVNYDDDELAVKLQLTDTLLESLLFDTVKALGPAIHKWSSSNT